MSKERQAPMRFSRSRGRRAYACLALALALTLAGCKMELYRDLSEQEANNMVATLLAAGVPATKVAVAETFTVQVDEGDMLRSISILNAKGLPRDKKADMGTVFQKSGIMSSPFEERVRYIYALSEEVSQTLSQIDGVVTARVHIVLPNEPTLGQPVKPSSAAVFIKHRPGVDLDFFVPQIRRLVSSSIEGLDYAAVTVVLSEAEAFENTAPNATPPAVSVLPGVAVLAVDAEAFWSYVYFAIGIVVLLLGVIGGLGFLFWRATRGKRPAAATGTELMEPT